MFRLNRDTFAAIVLLVFCGGAFAQTFAIPKTAYESMSAAVWPRFIIVLIWVLSLIYLWESLVDKNSPLIGAQGGVIGFVKKYWNALQCYLLFGFFVVTLPFLGFLVSGFLYVFLTLVVIGERTLRAHAMHFFIAAVTVASFWAIFTIGLGVILP